MSISLNRSIFTSFGHYIIWSFYNLKKYFAILSFCLIPLSLIWFSPEPALLQRCHQKCWRRHRDNTCSGSPRCRGRRPCWPRCRSSKDPEVRGIRSWASRTGGGPGPTRCTPAQSRTRADAPWPCTKHYSSKCLVEAEMGPGVGFWACLPNLT